MDKCPMCGYNERVSNTLQATVMNKFKDQHGNSAVFNKPNDLQSFEVVVNGEKFIWTKVATPGSKSAVVGQALNSKQAEVLKEINDNKTGVMGGSDMPIMATATLEGESPANSLVAKQPQLTYDEVQQLAKQSPVQQAVTKPQIILQPPTK